MASAACLRYGITAKPCMSSRRSLVYHHTEGVYIINPEGIAYLQPERAVYHQGASLASFAPQVQHHWAQAHIICAARRNIIGRKPTSFAPSGATSYRQWVAFLIEEWELFEVDYVISLCCRTLCKHSCLTADNSSCLCNEVFYCCK